MTDAYSVSSSELRKDVKRSAKSILNDHNVRIKLILASLVCLASFMLSEIVKESARYALSFWFAAENAETFTLAFNSVFSVASLLMLSPLFIGMFSYSVKLAARKDADFSELFVFYSGKKALLRTWSIGALTMIPQKLIFFLIVKIPEECALLVEKSSRSDTAAAYILGAILLEIGAFCLGILFFRLYTLINVYVCGSDQSILTCVCMSLKSTKRNCFNVFVFLLSFGAWILLSLSTVGVLFIIFTIPYMIVSYNLYSSYLITKNL